jgi:hypothetical protein
VIALSFIRKATSDSGWAFSTILGFLEQQIARVNNREITGATVRNYVKAIKLICEMADIPIQWKKLTRGLPRAKSYADDRIPSMEELRRLLEYPERRIKSLVCTMASSGIRIGAWDYLRWGNIQPIEREGKIVAAQNHSICRRIRAVFLLYANQWTSVGGCYLLETNIYNVHT